MDDESMSEDFPSFRKSNIYKGVNEDEKTFRLFEKCLDTRQFHFATALAKRFTKSAHETCVRKWRLKQEFSRDKVYERDETLLHYVINFPDTNELLDILLQICPDLAYVPRTHQSYYGQTPLHIAIASGNRQAFNIILKKAWLSSHKNMRKLVNVRATGTKFNNTVMMGELPLFVAALRNDQYMVKSLIAYGAVPYVIKGNGDTVFHVLIQYAALYRDKVKDVRKMIACIHGQIKKLMVKAKETQMKKKKMNHKFESMKKKQEAQSMLITKYKKEDMEETRWKAYDYRHVWYIKNNQQLTPLELAAKNGLTEIFNDILNLEDVYCHPGQQDGLFDEKSYDITEIDTIAKYLSELGVDDEGELEPDSGWSPFRRYPKQESVLQMMCGNQQHFLDVAALIDLSPIKLLLKNKWHFYRIPYIAWMIFHYMFVIVLSAFAVNRSEVVFSSSLEDPMEDSQSNFSTGYSPPLESTVPGSKTMFVSITRWILFAIAVVYFIVGVLEIILKIRKPNAIQYTMDNFNYIAFILVLSIGIITDAILHLVWYEHDGIPMIAAVLAAWWFNSFFLRGWRLFGFFMKMIQRVVFGDFFRFSVIIVLQLVSFTTTMTVVYQDKSTPAIDGTEENPGQTTNYQSALFKMFNLMIGLTELPFLSQTKQSWLAYGLYVLFILTTYILLINALIAMMSSTCASLLHDRYSQWRVQQLSVIIFLEDLLSLFSYDMKSAAGGSNIRPVNVTFYNPSTGTAKIVRRYYLKMSYAVQNVTYHEVAEVASTIDKQDEIGAECAADKDIIENIQHGILAEPEAEESLIDGYAFWDLSSEEEDDTKDNHDPYRFYTIYHEYGTNGHYGGPIDDNSDADSTESRLRTISKMASRGRIIAYPRKPKKGKVMSLET
ncbi:transient receptor potential cation channel subfamily V member 6-like [Argopecten irradians]|uniref:transient receptor potential cation channel subfamily V member 6-like n=1 Tax=Argopecten irradians TaxID=31199 RepID=UPI0037158D36